MKESINKHTFHPFDISILCLQQYDMKRRNAIKSLSALTLGITLFPGCSDGLAFNIKNGQINSFSDNQKIWINAMSDAILPKRDEVLTTIETFPDFVLKMISFNKSVEDQTSFFNGYNQCTSDIKDLYEISTKKLTSDQIVNYFSSILNDQAVNDNEQSDEEKQTVLDKRSFCQTLRLFSIKHLITSKEYQEQVLKYKLVPDSYQSCIEV